MMHGLNTYDYSARQYNLFVSSFDRMDPLYELFHGSSPFAYCHNNPVDLTDVNGMFATQSDAWRFVSFGINGMGYSDGGTSGRYFHEKESENRWWKSISDTNTVISTGLGFTT
jgi:hypothetical protein